MKKVFFIAAVPAVIFGLLFIRALNNGGDGAMPFGILYGISITIAGLAAVYSLMYGKK